jgi:EAL domain-containing protein (putative c-di-GMP-specific phosphodiesterase class I)
LIDSERHVHTTPRGVHEDQRSLDRLAEMGCDVAQGYHIARPMAVAELEAWLATFGLEPASTAAGAAQP